MIDRDEIARLLPDFHAARLDADAQGSKLETLETLLAEQQSVVAAAADRLSDLRKRIVAATGTKSVMYKIDDQLYALMPDDLTEHEGPIEIEPGVVTLA